MNENVIKLRYKAVVVGAKRRLVGLLKAHPRWNSSSWRGPIDGERPWNCVDVVSYGPLVMIGDSNYEFTLELAGSVVTVFRTNGGSRFDAGVVLSFDVASPSFNIALQAGRLAELIYKAMVREDEERLADARARLESAVRLARASRALS